MLLASALTLAGPLRAAPEPRHPGHPLPGEVGHLAVEIEGDGPALFILAAGPGLDHACFHPYLSALADTHTLVYIDALACAAPADDRPAAGGPEPTVDDLERLRRRIGRDRIDILAHGRGQIPAALYAARHPGRVGRLIFVGASLRPVPLLDHPTVLENMTAAMREQVAGVRDDRYLSDDGRLRERFRITAELYFHRLTDRGFHRAFVAAITLCAGPLEAVARDPQARVDLSAALGDLQAPLLIIAGRHDLTSPPGEAEVVRQAARSARVLILEDSGSFPFVEQPVDFVKAVQGFLAEGTTGNGGRTGAGGGI